MDSKMTGQLIAQRRGELGLTQKQLAERLHVSDRAVSRWERGVGFPDLSLLEPLADALGLSVLELLHGEMSPGRSPQADTSVREALRALWPQVGARLKRARRGLIVLGVLLCLAAAALIWLIAHPIRGYEVSTEPITAAQAADLCPDIFITTGEYGLLAELTEREEIQALFSDTANSVFPEDSSAPYRDRVLVEGGAPDYFRISVIGRSLWVEYGTGLASRTLTLNTGSGRVEKCAARYSGEPVTVTGPNEKGEATTIFLGRDPEYVVLNCDNARFSQSTASRTQTAP
ncbi:MAG: helix-turn-helix domain-containing protein [Candidatus Enterenecus sp.]